MPQDDSNSTTDNATADLQSDAADPKFPDPCNGAFPKKWIPYVSGHPDRLVFGRFFQPVYVGVSLTASGANVVSGQTPFAKSQPKVTLDESDEQFEEQLKEYEAQVEKLFDPSGGGRVTKRALTRQLGGAGFYQLPAPPIKTKAYGTSSLQLLPYPVSVMNALLGKVGLLYYDRIRFRNVGTVIGEHLTTLSVAPNEEVSFTQTSSTVLTTRLEDERTREIEKNYSLSSTWSTDWGSDVARDSTTQIGGDLGADGRLNVPIPELGNFITLGGDIAANFDQSQAVSRNYQTNYAFELVQEIGRRTRNEHKTIISVATEDSTVFESQRRITNRNALRSLILKFYKIYNKELVTLERYDVKLSVSVCITNPIIELLTQAKNAVLQLDPEDPNNYNCNRPSDDDDLQPRSTTLAWEDPFGTTPHDNKWSLLDANPSQQGMVLHGVTDWQIDEWKIKVINDDFTVSELDGDIDQFFSTGGVVDVSITDPSGQQIVSAGTPGDRRLRIGVYPASSGYLGPLDVLGPGAWWTSSISISATLKFITDPTQFVEYAQCAEVERQRLQDELSTERIDSIIHAAFSSVKEHIFQKAIRQCFGEQIGQSGVSPTEFLLKEFRHYFDWNEAIIQYAPSWMGGSENAEFEALKGVIANLYPGYDLERTMPTETLASGAQVVIPIRDGYEDEVLSLLSPFNVSFSNFLSNYTSKKLELFGPTDRVVISPEELMSPACMVATPACSGEWNSPWEEMPKKFEVLNSWSEYSPTDGVHIEPLVSDCTGADESVIAELTTLNTVVPPAKDDSSVTTDNSLSEPGDDGGPDD